MRTEQRNLGARQQQGPVGGELAIPVHSYGAFAIAIISTNALAAASANVASLMFAATRRTTRDGVCTTSLVSSSNSASIASASWNGMPGASMSERPPPGSSSVSGPVDLFSLAARKPAILRSSSAVVRISVTCALCTCSLRALNCAGTLSAAPKLTMSRAPTETTAGSAVAASMSSRSGPAVSTPPTTSSATSVVVRSSTPASTPDVASFSIALPPAPVAWNVSTSYCASSALRTASQHGVVTPNMDMASIGLAPAATAFFGCSAMPAAAAAAFDSTDVEMALMPATSTTEGMTVTSEQPT
mmetsp:Transcript_50154/g.138952  ORF Transcript_50154/g.138952 Transcript_50154/m.138952 type:complete len:301 (+) Transcript_50154:181-1083(+)